MFAPPNLLASKASSGHILLASEMAQLDRLARAQTRSLPALQARAGKMAIDNECYRQRIEKERFVASLPLDADDPTDTGLPAYRAPPSDVYSAYGHSHSSLPWNSDVSVKEVLNEDRLPAPAWSARFHERGAPTRYSGAVGGRVAHHAEPLDYRETVRELKRELKRERKEYRRLERAQQASSSATPPTASPPRGSRATPRRRQCARAIARIFCRRRAAARACASRRTPGARSATRRGSRASPSSTSRASSTATTSLLRIYFGRRARARSPERVARDANSTSILQALAPSAQSE